MQYIKCTALLLENKQKNYIIKIKKNTKNGYNDSSNTILYNVWKM